MFTVVIASSVFTSGDRWTRGDASPRRFPFSVSLLPYTPYHAHARRTPRIEHQNPLSFRRMIHPSFERSAFFHFR